MMTKVKTINDLIKIFSKLPSLGPRSAKRIILHLLTKKENLLLPLISLMDDAYKNIKQCKCCGNLTINDVCDICADKTRQVNTICVVETIADLWNIETSGVYNGLYHILGGNLSASEGRNPDDLNIDGLLHRIKGDKIEEVIIATNPTIEGQTTAFYISDLLQEFKVKITKPALGIPLGSELNFLDESTLDIAFKNKKEF
ncbi:MAG: recombination mediator RecR [Rickettsiales bacterium]|jgi:recombination protein RecR|nr:recombination mediator RecR [Rickettsiales bacterium]